MFNYIPTIGLEVHAELKTLTKMFCSSRNDPDEVRPNTNVCPVCMAFPGTLPTVNREAVRQVLRVGSAVNGTLADYTEFDRKNYFYPDLPKGYQISQYKFPLVVGGMLLGVPITRIHLEEDTARSQHLMHRTGTDEYSLVDFNRAGVPLMELVTEPAIHDAKTASAFARELQLLLRYLGAGDANMEKGQMRVEANISVSTDLCALGTKVEIKNLNSFRSVERAIAYEIDRQVKILKDGEVVAQETRGWDEIRGKTFSQRLKESSHDYRYFPDPDIPKFSLSRITEFSSKNIRDSLPELPWEKRTRLGRLGFLQNQDVEQLVGDLDLAELFDEVARKLEKPDLVKTAANFILNSIVGERGKNPDWPLPQADFLASVVKKYCAGELASPQARSSILSGALVTATDKGTLPELVRGVIRSNPKVAEEVRSGKVEAIKFLIGQGMKESKGSANPQELEWLIREELKV